MKKLVSLLLLMIMFVLVGCSNETNVIMEMLCLTRTIFSLIFPSVLQVYNLILMKSYIEALPKEIEESALIDGATELQTLVRIILPLSLPSVASVALFTAVTYWNNYTNALIYLGTAEQWYPLSLYILNHINNAADPLVYTKVDVQKANIESAMIIVSIIPILVVYPFVLKHFTKGITVGGVKE